MTTMQPYDPTLPKPETNPESGTSLFSLANLLLHDIHLLVRLPLILAVLFAGFVLLFGRQYTAHSSFIPESGNSDANRLAGIAAQFGVGLPGVSQNSQPIEFYRSLIYSREILSAIATTEYVLPTHSGRDTIRASFLELYGIEGDTEFERLLDANDLLANLITVATDRSTNLVTVRTKANSRELAVGLNRRILDLVSAFNLEKRQSKAAAERQFVETRRDSAQRELVAVENALESFLEANRTYHSSPQLSFEAARLQRRVDLLQQVYLALARGYEQARIDEVRNTPVITIIDHPEGSARPAARPIMLGMLGAIFGIMLAVAITFTRAHVARARAIDPAEYQRFITLQKGAVGRVLGRFRP
jgi:uncharacterized protein involved in exopolysaccharide biosynthesis